MILKIVKYPEPVLSQPGEPVTKFDDKLRKFVADLFETMYAAQGIGLAAPQVAVSKRVTVIDSGNVSMAIGWMARFTVCRSGHRRSR